MEDKRFYRSNQHRILGGVCGGLGDYFDIDPVIMRIIFFILAFAGGGGVLIYIILWILVPEEPVLYSKKAQTPPNNHSQNSSNPFNTENMNAENVHFEEMGNDSSQSDNKPKNGNTPQKSPEKNNGTLIAGIMLIVLGCMFLIDRFIPNINFGDLWPLILVAIGVILIYENYKDKPVKK